MIESFSICTLLSLYMQVVQHTAILTLVLVVDKFFWMMCSVHPVLTSYWNVLAGQSCPITVSTLMMLVWVVKARNIS